MTKSKSLARQAAMEIFGGNFDEIIIGGAPFNAEVEAFLKQDRFPLHHCLRHDRMWSDHLLQPLGYI